MSIRKLYKHLLKMKEYKIFRRIYTTHTQAVHKERLLNMGAIDRNGVVIVECGCDYIYMVMGCAVSDITLLFILLVRNSTIKFK